MRAPDSGLIMKRWAVAGFCSAGTFSISCAAASIFACRFQKLNSCVPVMQSAQDCMCDNIPEALDRVSVWCILRDRNMRTPPIIIGGEFRKNLPQVLFVEHDQMIGTLAPDRPDQAQYGRSARARFKARLYHPPDIIFRKDSLNRGGCDCVLGSSYPPNPRLAEEVLMVEFTRPRVVGFTVALCGASLLSDGGSCCGLR